MLKYNIDLPLDSPERTLYHRELIKKKTFLRKLYLDWYNQLITLKSTIPDGKILELGSGGGFLKEILPDIICSDILPLPTNDLTFSALDIPLENSSLSAIFMIDTFHHIPDSERFLKEVYRVLKPDGKIMMIEPANSLWGRFIYKNFHHEPFRPDGTWMIPDGGPMSGANGALPWIVFERDKKTFHEKFPTLKIVNIRYHTPFMYLISGGLTMKQLLPDFLFSFVKFWDKLLSSICKHFSMFVTITICKES